MLTIENKTYDELSVGDTGEITRTLTSDDIALFAAMSGDLNPAHLDEEFAQATQFHEVIGHGMWSGALISTVLGMELPGPGTIYLGQTLEFSRPVKVGDKITVSVTLVEKKAKGRVVFACECANQRGEIVVRGEATVIAPVEKIVREIKDQPRAVLYERGERLKRLIEAAGEGSPLPTGVIHPVTATTLLGAAAAKKAHIIAPLLIGPLHKIQAAAEDAELDISDWEIIDVPHSHAAAEKGVMLAASGRVEALMKGAIHTDEMMSAVVAREGGLRTERRISHAFIADTAAYSKLLCISDAAINIAPDLDQKRDIIQNAIDIMRAIGVETPKVAILSAVETILPNVQSTIDAAALCKMADRGQITGGIVDGPLAFDNAVSKAAADAKALSSPVAGDADIVIVPTVEAGNIVAKQLDYLSGAVVAGIVLGARVPIILTSRAEGVLPRVASSAVAKLCQQTKTVAE